MDGVWQDLMVAGVPIAEKVVRTIAVYAFLIIGLRLFGKRELGQLNPLDFIVLLLLSNTVQNAIIGNDNSLVGGIIGAGVLFVINDLLVRYAYRNPRFRRMIEGRPEELIRDGHFINRALEHNFITKEEVVAAARKQGIEHLHEIQCARLEVSGALSFTMHEPGAAALFQKEVLAKLAAIEKRLPAAAVVLLVAILALGPRAGVAQGTPSTDVWIVALHDVKGGAPTVGQPRNLTSRQGYDNQPGFSRDGKTVYYTVVGADTRADIWRVPSAGGKPVQVTATPESEYSATMTPDGKHFSVIRVEADSAQRLWQFPLDGRGAPSLVLERIKPVGYHAWANDHQLGLFVLGRPATLQLADTKTGNAELIARNIGRALQKVPGAEAVSFVLQGRDTSWIARLDVKTKAVTSIAPAPKGADFHAWTPAGTLVTGSGSVLYALAATKHGKAWVQVADLAKYGVRNISRLAISPAGDWLAFVADDQR